MDTNELVGRAGALAVALGIGAAVATAAPGIARATEDSASSDGSKSASSQDVSSIESSSPATASGASDGTHEADGKRPESSVSASGGANTSTRPSEAADSSRSDDEPNGVDSAVADDRTSDEAAIEPVELTEPSAGDDEPLPDESDSGESKAWGSAAVAAKPVTHTSAQTREAGPALRDVAPKTHADAEVEAAQPDALEVTLSAPAATSGEAEVSGPRVAATADAPELPAVDAPLPYTGFLSSVLTIFGWTPILGQSPAPAPEPPTLWGLMAWVRRQVQETFFNKTPTAASEQLAYSPTNGVVLGRINAVDAEGDQLMWRVVQGPTHGTVTLGPDGSYSYTPDAQFAGTGGVDAFIVSVRDVGLHLHLLNGTGQTLVAVRVTVAPVAAVPDVGLTKGFDIVNLSEHPVKLDGFNLKYNFPVEGPSIGHVLQPGEVAHFELQRSAGVTRVEAHFVSTVDPNVTFWAGMQNETLFGVGEVTCSHSGKAACSPTRDPGWTVGTVVALMDAPGTFVEIGSNRPGLQGDVLNQLCDQGSQAKCSFEVGRQENVYGAERKWGGSYYNDSDYQQSKSVGIRDATGYSDSVKLSDKFKVSFLGFIDNEITAEYGHTWSKSFTFMDEYQLTVPPWTDASLLVSEPFWRVYGDFTIEMGNTTYLIHDVYFDTPNPDPSLGLRVRPHYIPIPTPIDPAKTALLSSDA